MICSRLHLGKGQSQCLDDLGWLSCVCSRVLMPPTFSSAGQHGCSKCCGHVPAQRGACESSSWLKCYIGMAKGCWVGPGRRPTDQVIHFHHRLDAGPLGKFCFWFQSCLHQMVYDSLPCLSLKPLGEIKGDHRRRYQTVCSMTLEKAMATHSSTFAWKIPWTVEPGRLQSIGSRRVGHD